MCGISANRVADLCGQILNAQQTIELRAQFVVIDHIAQLGDTRSKGFLTVLREEEAGIRQTWTHNTLVATDDVLRIGHLHIRHNQELVAQLAGAIEQREVLLVLLHGQNQTLLRHFQKLWFEFADVNDGPFNQRGDFVEQAIGLVDLRTECFRLGGKLGTNGATAFGVIRDHLAFVAQGFGIIFRARDRDQTFR